ncbi:flavin-containing monooxygenase [Flagellimonas flava]|uniref:flavin-containing monooxygenase n=1 Tax=Flagellimonas flava TaxID=570519 RepID=UPI003D662489
MSTKVCVIGAGPSGLVAVKELLKQNIEVVCYEAEDSFGGAFRDIDKGGRSYDSLELTVSNYFMAYSDFMPDPKEERRFWKVSEYREYLKDYIRHFDLEKHLHYAHKVLSTDIQGNSVVVEVEHQGEVRKEKFDHLVICTGSNFIPYSPMFKGQSDFEGEIVHSSEYKNGESFKGKKVVCIGIGESGADIIHEISQTTSCRVLVREFPNIVPRWSAGYTSDSYTSHSLNSMGKKGVDHFMKFMAWKYLKFGKNVGSTEKLVQQWIYERKSFMGKFLTKSDVFLQDILDGRLEITRDEIDYLTKNTIVTKGGETIEADVLVLNTGYETKFEYVKEGKDFENPRNLYKHMIHPKHGLLISLIGWARPTQGGLPACSEIQARYMALLLSGNKKLPNTVKMKDSIEKDRRFNEKFFSDSVNIKSLVNYHDFMNDMSKLVGCRPKYFNLRDLKFSTKLFFGSHLPAFYRLNDPAYASTAKKTIKLLPTAYSAKRSSIMLLILFSHKPFEQLSRLFTRTFGVGNSRTSDQAMM